MLTLTGNLIRVLNVEHNLYTSCPQSKRHRAATQQFISPPILHTDMSADIKKYLQTALAKVAQAATKSLVWMFLPLLKEYAF